MILLYQCCVDKEYDKYYLHQIVFILFVQAILHDHVHWIRTAVHHYGLADISLG
jgi:hypothetical protein